MTKVTLSSLEKEKAQLPDEDDTFCFRFRVDDDKLNIKNLKGKGFELLKNAAGRYKKQLELKPSKPQTKGG